MLKVSDNPPLMSSGLTSLEGLTDPWWVAHTRSRSEKALAWDLIDRSIGYFLPMATRTAIWGGKRRKIMAPLFPSYVFFNGGPATRQEVLRTNRVCQIIEVRQREQFISELEAIRLALESNCVLNLYPYAVVGNRCRVARGSLRGIEGTVLRTDDITRLILQVSLLGRGASLEISADLLEPA